jgi:hypothetical protein
MSASFVQFSGSERRNGVPYSPIQRASASKIHTIHDWQQTESEEETEELEELLRQTTILMNSAKETVEKYSDSVASNGVRLRNITRRTQFQEDGQAELASKIESAERSTAETRRQVFDAKRAGWNAVVSVSTFGVTTALRTMSESSCAEQQASHASGHPSSFSELPRSSYADPRDRLPNNNPFLRQRADRVIVNGESSPPGWPPRNEAEWDRLVSEAEKQNGGNGGAISPWIPINPVANTSSRPVPAVSSVGGLVLCGYGDPESNFSNDPSTPEWAGDREYGHSERGYYPDGFPKTDWSQDPRWQQAEWHRHVGNVFNEGVREHLDEVFAKSKEYRVYEVSDNLSEAISDAWTSHQRYMEANALELQIAQDAAKEYHAHKK